MRLRVKISKVEPGRYPEPIECPYCHSRAVKLHQGGCSKAVRDLTYEEVEVQRQRCLSCRRTFRVYPEGVSRGQQSQALKALSVMLYLLGLSYGAVTDVLEVMGALLGKPVQLGKTTVYRNVQEAGEKARRLRRRWLEGGKRVRVIGADITQVKCGGESLLVGVVVDDRTGIELSVEILEDETTESLLAWLKEVADLVGAEVVVTDDADGLKTVADDLDLAHQICRAHVTKNTLRLVGELGTQAMEAPHPPPPGVNKGVEEFLADLEEVQRLIESHPHDGQARMKALHLAYCQAPPPGEGEKATMWYRMRLLTLDRWENWPRLTLYQRWRGPQGERIDGTNNGAERAIGWWVKERYRSMRGYKRRESVLNVSTLLGWLGAQTADYDLAELVAA